MKAIIPNTLPWYFAIPLVAFFALGIFFRVWHVDTLTGVNADETVVPVLLQRTLQGNGAQWKMPTGRYPGLLYTSTIGLAQALLPHSFLTLRIFPAAIGILFCFLALRLLQTSFNTRIAVLTTIFLCALPLNIAYSRLAIEQSCLGLTVLFILHFAHLKNWRLALLSLLLSFLVHPLHIFLLPYLFVLFVLQKKECPTPALGFSRWTLFITLGLIATLSFIVTPNKYFDITVLYPWLKDPKNVLVFVESFVATFSGRIVTFDLAGDFPTVWQQYAGYILYGSLGFCFLALVTAFYKRNFKVLAPLMGCFAVFTAIYFFAGAAPFVPGLQRYAMIIVTPFALAFAVSLDFLFSRFDKGFASFVFTSVLGIFFFLGIYYSYFKPLQETGGTSHAFYRTSQTEPKESAVHWLLSLEETPTQIQAEDWWTYWTLAYLLPSDIPLTQMAGLVSINDFPKGVYAVGFPFQVLDTQLSPLVHSGQLIRKDFLSQNNQRLLSIWYRGNAPETR